MNAHNMVVDVSARAVINCSLPLLHGLCIGAYYYNFLCYYCLLLMLCRIALFHRTNIKKLNNIMKVSDLYQLQVFSFMHDLVNNKLPGSFDDFIPITNESYYAIQ